MRNKRIGKRTMKMQNSPTIISTASIVGPKEGKGPLKDKFDVILPDDLYGEKTWELAESKMIQTALETAVQKVEKQLDDIEFLFGGDLINQIFPASFAARALGIPFCGIYGACSTMALGMCLSSIVVDGGFADYALNGTSSHYCTAERQFRFPLELGNQKPMTAQWTVTGAGSALISSSGEGPKVKYITIGKVVDKGIDDGNNMGAAMAPAFADTLVTHFLDTGRNPSYYDAIISGDLGYIGKDIAIDIAKSQGYNIKPNYNDCGVLIFDKSSQDTHSGGSGCACCGTVFSGYLFKQLKEKKIKKLLLIATGALMNSTSSQQGESIPGVAHAISIEL